MVNDNILVLIIVSFIVGEYIMLSKQEEAKLNLAIIFIPCAIAYYMSGNGLTPANILVLVACLAISCFVFCTVSKIIAGKKDRGETTEDDRGETTDHHLKILFLFSCPRNVDRIRLDKEDRVVRECFERGRLRESIKYSIRHAVRVDDLRRAIIDEKPDIVHFSGHGTGGTIVLEDEQENSFKVPLDALGEYLSRQGLKCVVLNACETQALGRAIRGVITIAMPQPISDEAAIEFTKGFYDRIAAGDSPRKAYDEGCSNVELKNLADDFPAEYLEP